MTKAKIYRIGGYIFAIIFGIIGYIVNICQPWKYQQFIANPDKEFMPAVFGCLASFALNIFLWAGLLMLWKADRIEHPDKQTKWGKVIKVYLIFTVIILLWMAYLIIVPNLLRAK